MKPAERERRERQSRDATQLKRMADSAVDLGGGPLSGEKAAEVKKQAEGQLGLRCSGCGERVGVGFKFTKIEVVVQEGQPTVNVLQLTACNGQNECDFAMQAKENGTVMEAVEYVWLDGDDGAPADARAARASE